MQQFYAAKEKLIEDREGEIKITFTVPKSDKHKVLDIPTQKPLIITVLEENEVTKNSNKIQVEGCQDL